MNDRIVRNDATKTPASAGRPTKLRRRIGSTTYSLSINFSETATETAEQKLLRMIEREVDKY